MLGYNSGTEIKNVAGLIGYVISTNKAMNIPLSIRALVDDDFMNNLDEIAQIALDDNCTLSNPADVTVADIKEILTDIFKGVFDKLC